MKTWSKEFFGNIHRRKRRILARIQGIHKSLDQFPNDFLLNLEFVLIEEYNLVCFQEETMLRQKSLIDWLQYGDCNSKFYYDLYTDPHPALDVRLPSLCEHWKLSHADRNILSRDVTLEEVRSAVFDMSPKKSPGIDGFPAIFFQKAWHLVGESILALVRSALQDGKIDPTLNRTLKEFLNFASVQFL